VQTVGVMGDGRTYEYVVGLRAAGRVEIREGIAEGEEVVSVSGSFVRNGDRVTPVAAVPR